MCIGCGCQRAYNNCLKGNGANHCSQWPNNYTGDNLTDCCQQDKNDCHGTGIRIGFGMATGTIGSTVGGQILVPYHLLTQEQMNQITPQLQTIIDNYLDGIQLSDNDWNYINSLEDEGIPSVE